MNSPQQAAPTHADSFGKRLLRHREAAGLSQAELAAKIGVSQSAIGHWERSIFTPRGRNVNALAVALAVDASELHGTSAVAGNLLAARQQSGLTQGALASMVGVSQQTVAKWESGTATPRNHHLKAVTTALDGANQSAIGAAASTSELLMAELIIVTMMGALTAEQKATVAAQLEAAGVAGSDMIRSQERRAAIVAGSAA